MRLLNLRTSKIFIVLLLSQLISFAAIAQKQPRLRQPKRFHPEKLHAYPRSCVFKWGGAPAEFLARFDLVMSKIGNEVPDIGPREQAFLQKLRSLNPNVIWLTIRDWTNASEEVSKFPEEWYLHDSKGNRIELYGPKSYWANLSDLCPELGGSLGGVAIKNRILADWFGEYLATLDNKLGGNGVGSQGLYYKGHVSWYGFDDVDMDGNGVNDNDEHGKSWIVDHWVKGVDRLIQSIRDHLDSDSYIVINTGSEDLPRPDLINGLYYENINAIWNWEQTVGTRRSQENKVQKPAIFVMNHEFDRKAPGVPRPTKNAFEFFRGGLARAAITGNYYDANSYEASEHYWKEYYDEFELDIGWPTTGAIQVKDLGGQGYGIWVRFFDDGAIIGNMSDKTATVTDADLRGISGYNGPYWRFLGGQDTKFNNGQKFDAVELPGYSYSGYRDKERVTGSGIVLVRKPTTAVANIILDSWMHATSAGSKEAELTPEDAWQHDCNRTAWSPRCVKYKVRGGGPYYDVSTTTDKSANAVYTPTIGVPGKYEVYEWHGKVDNAATNVRYEIHHSEGSDTKTVNQQKEDGKWNYLGSYHFARGTNGKITLSAKGANGVVQADGIMLVFGESKDVSAVDVMPPATPQNVKAEAKQ
jgi:hypothetical protein